MPCYLVYDFVEQSVFAGEILTPNASFVVYMEGARANEGGCARRQWRLRARMMEAVLTIVGTAWRWGVVLLYTDILYNSFCKFWCVLLTVWLCRLHPDLVWQALDSNTKLDVEGIAFRWRDWWFAIPYRWSGAFSVTLSSQQHWKEPANIAQSQTESTDGSGIIMVW